MNAALERKCTCGGTCGGCSAKTALRDRPMTRRALRPSRETEVRATNSRFARNFSTVPVHAPQASDGRAFAQTDGDAEEHERLQAGEGVAPAQGGTTTPTPAQTPTPAPTTPAPTPTPAPTTPAPAATPCPASVSVGSTTGFNHSNLSATDKDRFGTYLGTVSLMNVGPGPDHSGHCMRETLTAGANTCPAAVMSQFTPCSGHRCLDINRGRSMGDAATHSMVTDGPTSFIDLHRLKGPTSLLAGTGVNSCSIVCSQTYKCDSVRGAATTGTFTITRNLVAGTHTRADGTTVPITTGTVTKT